MVYCAKQQEIDQESQRSDVATGNATLRWPTQTQTQTQRCGALRFPGSQPKTGNFQFKTSLWFEVSSANDEAFTSENERFKRATHQGPYCGDSLGDSQPAKSKRGQEEGDGTENVLKCRRLSRTVVTFHDEFYDDV